MSCTTSVWPHLADELVRRIVWQLSSTVHATSLSCRRLKQLVAELVLSPSWRRQVCNAAMLLRAGVWTGRAVWSADCRALPAHSHRVRLLAASPDERLVVTAGNRDLAIWGPRLNRLHTLAPGVREDAEVCSNAAAAFRRLDKTGCD